MVEGEQGMSTPERSRPITGREQTPEKESQSAFEEGLRNLIEPQKAINEKGEEIIMPPAIENEHLRRLARQALSFAGKTPEGIKGLIEKGNNLCSQGEIPEENWDEWSVLAIILDEELVRLEKRRQKAIRDFDGKERLIPRRDLPAGIGAIFIGGTMDQYIRNDEIDPQENMICNPWEKQGKIEFFTDDLGRKVEATARNGREGWLFENYYAATRERNAEQNWYGIVKFWCDDFEASVDWLEGRKNSYPQISLKEKEEFLRKMKAFGAVFASARAAEASKGDYSAYALFIAPPRHGETKPDLDKQDDWKDLLLAGDERKINIVLGDPLVRYFFEKTAESMGISVSLKESEPGSQEWEVENDWEEEKVKREAFEKKEKMNEGGTAFKEGTVPYYLEKGGQRGGFDGFIQEVLLSEESRKKISEIGDYGRHEIEAAAKIACDTILVNGMYTFWEYNYDEKGEYKFAPCHNWGGDPFRFMLKPSNLPRNVKKVYAQNPEVMDALDAAFCPTDVLDKLKNEKGEKKNPLLKAAGTTNLKRAYRLNAAIFDVIGDSQASALALFNEQAIDSLYDAAKLIDNVYGGEENYGKDLAGLMMGRILKTKAYALSSEWRKVNFREAFRVLMGGSDTTEAIFKAITLIWGERIDGSGGLIGKISGGQLKFRIKNNRLGAQKEFDEALITLTGFGIPKEQLRYSKRASKAKFLYDILVEIGRQKY